MESELQLHLGYENILYGAEPLMLISHTDEQHLIEPWMD